MPLAKLHRTMQALFLGAFAVFAFGFSHVTFGQPTMVGMEDMPGHSDSAVACQILCGAATKTEAQGILSKIENKDEANALLPIIDYFSMVSLSSLAVAFVVKRLHLLSSWRPPDLTLLYGHFADGL